MSNYTSQINELLDEIKILVTKIQNENSELRDQIDCQKKDLLYAKNIIEKLKSENKSKK